jgi:hypothetical protein
LSAVITRSDSWALDTPGLSGSRISAVLAGAEALRRVLADLELVDRAADAAEVDRVLVVDLDHRAAAEVDAEVEAARGEEEHGQQERDQRDHVEHQRVPHERDVAPEAEEFHVGYR